MTGRLGAGVIAGAGGTTVLNAITYADMALRGRPSSPVPARNVEQLAQRGDVSLGADEDSASARKEGLGGLMGLLTGTAGGVAVAVARPLTRGLPTPVAAALIAAAIMAATNAGSVRLGTTDPRSWSAADWAADVVPHLGYGAGVHLALRALEA
jgi:hypothetical protein